MRQHGLLAVNMVCRKCRNQMAKSGYDRVTDEITWRCLSQVCQGAYEYHRGRWSVFKAAFKREIGVARYVLPSYLDEHMWRVHHPRPLTFEAIMAAIVQQFTGVSGHPHGQSLSPSHSTSTSNNNRFFSEPHQPALFRASHILLHEEDRMPSRVITYSFTN